MGGHRDRPSLIRWRVAAAAMVGPSVAFMGLSVLSAPGRWNDFTTYWLAGKLVAAGISPYDVAALIRLGGEEGADFLAGTGYSYLPPLAVVMAPLGHLPLPIAALIFAILSIGAFGLAAALWLGDGRLTMHGTWAPSTARTERSCVTERSGGPMGCCGDGAYSHG